MPKLALGEGGVAYRYRIKALNHEGTTAWFGPVRVT